MRTQTFGVEIEMTDITRKKASEVAASYFGTRSEYIFAALFAAREHCSVR